VKLSEQAGKTSVPGLLQVRRYRHDGEYLADCIYDELTGLPDRPVIVDPLDHTRRREIPADAPGEDLLRPIFRRGELVYERPALAASRQRTSDELAQLHAGVKRFVNPHQFPAGLERNLFDLRTRLILEARGLPP
jgi:nicotinate phosphoribosyltransferase